MLRFLFYFFLFYLIYRFVFGFLIPMILTARRMRKEFRKMRDHMEEQGMFNSQQQREQAVQTTARQKATASPDDYIDFEEIK